MATANVNVRFEGRITGANALGGPDFAPEIEALIQLANGTGLGQYDLLYAGERTVAASTNDDIDLSGVLLNAFGTVINFAEIVGILVVNKRKNGVANTSNMTIGGATNPFIGFVGGTTPTIGPIRPGGVFLLISPDAAGIGTVVAGTGDILRIANGAGGQAVFQIAILGRSS